MKILVLSKILSMVICPGPATNNIYRKKRSENTEKLGRPHCSSTSSTSSSWEGWTGCGRWGRAPTLDPHSPRRLWAAVKRWSRCDAWECGGRRQREKLCLPQKNKAFMYVKLKHKKKLKQTTVWECSKMKEPTLPFGGGLSPSDKILRL